MAWLIIKRSLSCSPSLPPAETLAASVFTILKHHRSKSRWNQIRSLCRPTGLTAAEATEIITGLRNSPHLALRFFLFTLRHSLCQHTVLSYSTVIHTLSRHRLKSKAITLMQSALRHFPDENSPALKTPKLFETLVKTYRACDSAPFVFDLLIEACLRSSRTDQAVEIARMLQSRGISPTVITCNSLIRSVSKSRGCFAGLDLYKELSGVDWEAKARGRNVVVPNVHTFNEIMLGFYREGLVESVEEVWKEMGELGCEPNAYSYSILMAAYCEDGQMGEAVKLWEGMRIKGVEYDAVAYNTIIGGFCRIGEVGRAEEVFREMGLSGVECSCATFEHLISGYCQIGDVDSAILLYKDMCRKGLRPEGSTFDAIIEGLCGKNRVSEAMEFLRVAVRKYELSLKGKSYEFLIKGLCQEGGLEDALRLQAEMVGKGFQPNLEIYSAFIDSYTKQGNHELARMLKEEMLETQLPEEEE